MASWTDLRNAVPDLAKTVQLRFEATGLGVMATVRADGSPRICPVEPLFTDHLWLGMMEGSRKVGDLARDARLALHCATCDKEVKEGDAKLAGRAVRVDLDDRAAFRQFVDDFAASTGNPTPPGPFPLFRVDIAEVSFLRPGGDHLVIEWWNERDGYHRVERR